MLRSAKGKSLWAPETGIRYDGLYRIMEEKVRRNWEGERYVLFRLERMEGQGVLGRGGESGVGGEGGREVVYGKRVGCD